MSPRNIESRKENSKESRSERDTKSAKCSQNSESEDSWQNPRLIIKDGFDEFDAAFRISRAHMRGLATPLHEEIWENHCETMKGGVFPRLDRELNLRIVAAVKGKGNLRSGRIDLSELTMIPDSTLRTMNLDIRSALEQFYINPLYRGGRFYEGIHYFLPLRGKQLLTERQFKAIDPDAHAKLALRRKLATGGMAQGESVCTPTVAPITQSTCKGMRALGLMELFDESNSSLHLFDLISEMDYTYQTIQSLRHFFRESKDITDKLNIAGKLAVEVWNDFPQISATLCALLAQNVESWKPEEKVTKQMIMFCKKECNRDNFARANLVHSGNFVLSAKGHRQANLLFMERSITSPEWRQSENSGSEGYYGDLVGKYISIVRHWNEQFRRKRDLLRASDTGRLVDWIWTKGSGMRVSTLRKRLALLEDHAQILNGYGAQDLARYIYDRIRMLRATLDKVPRHGTFTMESGTF